MNRQLNLPITCDYIVKNNNVIQYLNTWPNKNSSNFLCLVGNSELASIWITRVNAYSITNLNTLSDEWYKIMNGFSYKYYVIYNADMIKNDYLLFHILNTAKELKLYILFTSNFCPLQWNIKLQDLISRLSWIEVLNCF